MKKLVAKHTFLMMRGGMFINGPVILYVGCSQLQRHLQDNLDFNASLVLLMPCALFIVWITGWLNWKLGLFGAEQDFTWRENPAYTRLTKGEPDAV